MIDRPFLKKIFYKYEVRDEVERHGKAYQRYSKTPRFSTRKIKRFLIAISYVSTALAILIMLIALIIQVIIRKR